MSTKMEDRCSAIRGQLEAAADILTKQGVIASRRASGRRVWSVRYRQEGQGGRRVHKSIYLGSNAELVGRAQGLLDQFRRREAWCREIESMAKLTARCAGPLPGIAIPSYEPPTKPSRNKELSRLPDKNKSRQRPATL